MLTAGSWLHFSTPRSVTSTRVRVLLYVYMNEGWWSHCGKARKWRVASERAFFSFIVWRHFDVRGAVCLPGSFLAVVVPFLTWTYNRRRNLGPASGSEVAVFLDW